MTRRRQFKSYPSGAGMAGKLPAYQAPTVGVDVEWVLRHGSRAQRRRLSRELIRQHRKEGA